MASRKISDLTLVMQFLAKEFAGKMAEAGIPFMFTCTKRSQEEQDRLYAQGRTTPGKLVTWTKKSKHIEGKAFDIAILKDGKATWDIKVSIDGDDIPDYQEAGEIGISVGLRWGGGFMNAKGEPTPDMPHFELSEL